MLVSPSGARHALQPLIALFAIMAFLVGCDPGASEPIGGSPNPPVTGGSDGAAATDVSDVMSASDLGARTPDTSGPSQPVGPVVPTYSGATCPGLLAGYNAIETGGSYRYLTIFMPPNPEGASVTFLWHGFGDSSSNFGATMNAGAISAAEHMIIVVPDPVYDPGFGMPPTWHLLGDSEVDLLFFDDVLACLEGQYDIDQRRVYTHGFSAGALWSSLLLIERSDLLAAATIWSGGTSAGGLVTVDYSTPARQTPALVGWGGSGDTWGSPPVGVNFETGCLDLVGRLATDGHLVIACNHGQGHTIPFDGFQSGWDFLLAHTWGEPSPYGDGSIGSFPSYCGLESP